VSQSSAEPEFNEKYRANNRKKRLHDSTIRPFVYARCARSDDSRVQKNAGADSLKIVRGLASVTRLRAAEAFIQVKIHSSENRQCEDSFI
jgi:hypothetical protein